MKYLGGHAPRERPGQHYDATRRSDATDRLQLTYAAVQSGPVFRGNKRCAPALAWHLRHLAARGDRDLR